MGQVKSEFSESLRHLHRALYLCAIRLLSICGTLISRIALAVSRKPKSALFVFAITFFSVCMYQQGRVVVAEQGNMKAMKLKDDTTLSSHPYKGWAFPLYHFVRPIYSSLMRSVLSIQAIGAR